MNVEQSACTFHIASLSMAANDNLSALCEAELIQALVDNIQLRDSVEHIGRKNRLMDQQRRILAELEARDGSLQSLRHLLDHADPSVQLCAAFALKNVDRPTCKNSQRLGEAERPGRMGGTTMPGVGFSRSRRRCKRETAQQTKPLSEAEGYAAAPGDELSRDWATACRPISGGSR
jgi:hypothetical protein